MVDPSHLRLALLPAAALGFRHGLDYDHIAAISDISSVQARARDAMRYGLLYVAGHATTIALLGGIAVSLRVSLPPASDRWAERLVGLTLLALGLYVLGTFFRPLFSQGSSSSPSSSDGSSSGRSVTTHGHSHSPRTRITLLINALLWVYWKLTRIFGGTRNEAPQIFKDGYGSTSTFVVGVIHGLGAETPTQIMLFLLAANLGGTATGLLVLLMFIAGLLFMNTLMCAFAAGLFSADKLLAWFGRGDSAQTAIRVNAVRGLTLLTSAYSIVVGAIFLVGAADKLPSLTGSG
jgi:cytochrome c biogenesis protein CcdA